MPFEKFMSMSQFLKILIHDEFGATKICYECDEAFIFSELTERLKRSVKGPMIYTLEIA